MSANAPAHSSTPSSQFSIKNTLKGKLPGLPFDLMKEKVLGQKYELSAVFVGPKKIQALNKKYRDKDKATDVLSFPLTKNSGEIFMCLDIARKRAPDFDRKPDEHVIFLFIHGLLHLKGLDHGSRMERAEKRFFSNFINGKKNSSRHRHRHVPDKSGRGRKFGI